MKTIIAQMENWGRTMSPADNLFDFDFADEKLVLRLVEAQSQNAEGLGAYPFRSDAFDYANVK